MPTQIAVVGAGRWGTTLSILLSRNGYPVTLICRSEEFVQASVLRESPYLPDFKIPKQVLVLDNYREIQDADYLIVAVPGRYLKETWESVKPNLRPETLVISVVKAIQESEWHFSLPTHWSFHSNPVVFFGAAAFPEGVLKGSPTRGTAYSTNIEYARRVAELFVETPIRPYLSRDLLGGQLGAALKNPIAIACGIAQGLGFDGMTVSTLISCGSGEISRFACNTGARSKTFGQHTTFMADLCGTCSSPFSRNARLGKLLAKYSLKRAKAQIQGEVEGIRSLEVLAKIYPDFAKEMPICSAVWEIINRQTTPKKAIQALMDRPIRTEGQ